MGDFPILQSGRFSNEGGGLSGYDTAITPSTSANTKGSWVEFDASTPFPTKDLSVSMGRGQTSNQWLLDVGIGAEGSEVVLIANLMQQQGPDGREATFVYHFPLWIPSGTRLSVRGQINEADSGGFNHTITLSSGGFPGPAGFSRSTTYGAATGDSGGTQVDPGGTANTKAAWAQLTGSSNAVRWLIVAVGLQANTAPASAKWVIDIGVGAATSEVVLIPDLIGYVAVNAGVNITPAVWSFPVSIPSGTRIAARAACDINDATDRLIDVIVYGVE